MACTVQPVSPSASPLFLEVVSNRTPNSRAPSLTTDDEFSYEIGDGETITEAVITAVTAVTNEAPDPSTGDNGSPNLPPLYTVIDPDALESLFRPASRGGRTTGYVEFRYADCEILVQDGGHLIVNYDPESST